MDRELDVAAEALCRAARLCERVRRAQPSAQLKSDQSPVTVADYGSQVIVASALLDAFPEDGILAEEELAGLEQPGALGEAVLEHVAAEGLELNRSALAELNDRQQGAARRTDRFWTLDPLDGTLGFLRGDQYCVALALIENGQVRLGLLACPNLPIDSQVPDGIKGCLFGAISGSGVWVRSLDASGHRTRIRVDAVDEPRDIVFCEPFEARHSAHDLSRAISGRLGVRRSPFRLDSQCKYAAVARGDCTCYMRLPGGSRYEEKVWDHAPGSLIVREAGGTVTDVAGTPLDFSAGPTLSRNRGIVASNGRLHDRIISACLVEATALASR